MANNENTALLHKAAEDFGAGLNDLLTLVHNLIRGGATHEQVHAILTPAKEAVAKAQAVAATTAIGAEAPNEPASSAEVTVPATAGAPVGNDPNAPTESLSTNSLETETEVPNEKPATSVAGTVETTASESATDAGATSDIPNETTASSAEAGNVESAEASK